MVVDNDFKPRLIPMETVTQGAIEIRWSGETTSQSHNVRQDDRLFKSGPPEAPFGQFDEDISAGRYHYYCQVHGSKAGGMDGVIKVRPIPEQGDGDSAVIFWADEEAEPKHRFTVQFRREGASKWKTWRKRTARISGNFGQADNPINAVPGTTYQVRARTFVKKKPHRRSGWSPAEPFTVDGP